MILGIQLKKEISLLLR